MKNNILFIISFILSTTVTFPQAPDIEWQNTIGGYDDDELWSLQQTTDGGFILGGNSDSGISGDKSEANISYSWDTDLWVVKLDVTGQTIEWENTIGGNSSDALYSIIQTTDGGYLLGGDSFSNISGDKSEDSWGTDYWIIKLNSSGNIEWQNTIGGDHNDNLHSMQQTFDGGYILGGYSASGVSKDKTEASQGDNDYWIVKLNSSGNIEWQNTIGGNSSDNLRSIKQTSDGGYILGGYSRSRLSGDKSEDNRGSYDGDFWDYWIVKLDATGQTIEWDKTFGGIGYEELRDVIQTSDGGYLLGGYSNSNISFDKTEQSNGGFDYWVIKLNSYGVVEWQNTIGGNSSDRLHSIQQTKDGGYILGGVSQSDMSGDKTTDNYNGGYDYWIVKIDATGQIYWDKTIGGGNTDWLNILQQTSDRGYILGGYSNSNISYDKTENDIGNTVGLVKNDYWVVKLYPDSPLDVEQSELIDVFKLHFAYPNPFNPNTTISYSLDKDSDVSINIYDISGKLITILQNEYQTQGEHSITWNGTDDLGNRIGAGIYFYQVKAGDFIETKKVVLVK